MEAMSIYLGRASTKKYRDLIEKKNLGEYQFKFKDIGSWNPSAKKPIRPRHVKTLNNFASRFIEDAPGGHPDFEL